ncbi:RadC family protein [Pseudohongiella acticola]|uniref:RadC family protein n=1 Tax=Pseudohongiella acticola TaxID=1524254 RepID=UPI0009F20D06|nr:DNA repair protein RadC [Pseudohongiella acticola]
MSKTNDLFPITIKSEYTLTAHQHAAIREAVGILETSFKRSEAMTNSDLVKQFCQLQIATKMDEHFGCMFLDNQHRLISYETMFNGTIDGAAVYPRVVVRRALEINAAAVIFTHNHPSGLPEPSQADIAITKRLKDSLALIDIRVLDHIIVGCEGTVSMSERGIL